ncbi:hypothetical protein [Muricoccus radiodurans]|uniref:hypothetical protein n=1 Tax=Muricoccus radiodurans TaxID=2231721 RepID=UPI003CF8DAC4
MIRPIVVALLALAALGAPPADAQEDRSLSWPERRCARYRDVSTEAFARLGTNGLTAGFLEAHAAFLASGCRDRRGVCPRSEQDLSMANTLTALAINAGAASTFLPFACRAE